MDRYIGPAVAHQHDKAGVCHDQCVRFHADDRFHVRQIGFEFGVVRIDVAGDIKLFAAAMRFVDSRFQRIERVKRIVPRPEAVPGLPGIDGIGAEIESGAHFFDRARRQQKFGRMRHDKTIVG